MYELPTITYVGPAAEVILGIAALGSDLDGSWVIPDFEYMEDGEATDNCAAGG
jgi:hypothetical protein